MTEEVASPPASMQVLALLSEGSIAVEGLIPWSSNAILLVTVRRAEASCRAIYKPQKGETPLWDFGMGTLAKREVAAYLTCAAAGWGFVPPTVLREGPFGLGSLQLFVEAREGAHYFTIRDGGMHVAALMRLAAFDAVANNADRKAGHCLLDKEGRLWAIDNALTFHVDPKMRTVIWDFAGQSLPADILSEVSSLRAALLEGTALSQALTPLLTHEELAALRLRVERLMASGRFPAPGPGRAVPWPLV